MAKNIIHFHEAKKQRQQENIDYEAIMEEGSNLLQALRDYLSKIAELPDDEEKAKLGLTISVALEYSLEYMAEEMEDLEPQIEKLAAQLEQEMPQIMEELGDEWQDTWIGDIVDFYDKKAIHEQGLTFLSMDYDDQEQLDIEFEDRLTVMDALSVDILPNRHLFVFFENPNMSTDILAFSESVQLSRARLGFKSVGQPNFYFAQKGNWQEAHDLLPILRKKYGETK